MTTPYCYVLDCPYCQTRLLHVDRPTAFTPRSVMARAEMVLKATAAHDPTCLPYQRKHRIPSTTNR